MKAIMAVNKYGHIGLNGKLPWKCEEDLLHFKELTMGCKLLVGFRTFSTLPDLPGREIIVYDKNNKTANYEQADWCIGGKSTYNDFCHLFTELHISHIDDETIGDTIMPNLDNLNPDCKVFHYYFCKNSAK